MCGRAAGTSEAHGFAEAVFASAPVVILVLDPDGRIQRVNPCFSTTTGYSAEEILGKDWFSTLLPERDRERTRDWFRRALVGEATRGNVNPIVTRAGEERQIEWCDQVQRDAAGRTTGLLCIGQDVTERKLAQDSLRLREELLSTVIGGAPLVIFALDREGRFTLSEGKALSLLGLVPGQMVGVSAFEAYADVPGMDPHLRRALAGETVHYRSCVGTIWFDATYTPTFDSEGNIAGVIGVAFDITEQVRAEEVELNRAEQAFRASQERLRSILDSLFGFVGLYTLDGVRVEANRKPLEAAGLTREEVLGKPFWEGYWWSHSQAVQAQARAAHGRAALGETVREDFRVRLREDVFITVDGTFSPLRDGDGRVTQVIGTAVDVTEQRRAQEALRASQVQLNEAQRIAQMGSWALDLRTNALEWSDEIFRIFEIDRTEFGASYEAFLNAVHPDDRDAVNDAYTRSVATQEPYQITHRLLMPDGRIKHVQERCETFYDLDGKALRSLGTVQDITAQRQSELLLQRTREQLEATLQAIPDLLFEVDESGRYLAVRAQRPELLAAPPEQLIGRTVRDVLPPEGAETALEALREAGVAGVSFGRTIRLDLADGSHWFEFSVARKAASDGHGHTYIVLSRDITERKRAEEAMRLSLNEKSLLLREVHHRVKNNLQVISSLLHLQMSSTKDPSARALLDESRTRVRAIATVHELLSQSADLSRVDFAAYLKNVTRGFLAAHAQESAPLTLSVDAADALLDIQLAVPCGLIVNELLTNVLKYAFPRGRSGGLHVSFRRNAENQWVLSVADDGVGLPGSVDPRAAESLGLRLVHTLATQIDATMRVDRSHGTRFEFTFAG